MRELLLFGGVGALGTLSNLLCFYYLSLLGIPPLLNACFCFLLAVSQNYLLNSHLTFEKSLSLRNYLSYIGANLFGLGINLCVLYLLERFLLESLLSWLDSHAPFSQLLDSASPLESTRDSRPSSTAATPLDSRARHYALLSFQACGIFCAFVSNFLISKYYIFKRSL